MADRTPVIFTPHWATDRTAATDPSTAQSERVRGQVCYMPKGRSGVLAYDDFLEYAQLLSPRRVLQQNDSVSSVRELTRQITLSSTTQTSLEAEDAPIEGFRNRCGIWTSPFAAGRPTSWTGALVGAYGAALALDELTHAVLQGCHQLSGWAWSPWTVFDDAEVDIARRLHRLLLETPLESGVTHPGEHLLGRAAKRWSLFDDSMFVGLVRRMNDPDAMAASVVLLARVGLPRSREARDEVIRLGLASTAAVVRHAAVEAIELLEDKASLRLLRCHSESLPWLRRYIQQVIADIAGAENVGDR